MLPLVQRLRELYSHPLLSWLGKIGKTAEVSIHSYPRIGSGFVSLRRGQSVRIFFAVLTLITMMKRVLAQLMLSSKPSVRQMTAAAI